MADPHSAVTDTHPLIFHAAGGRRLGPRRAHQSAATQTAGRSLVTRDNAIRESGAVGVIW